MNRIGWWAAYAVWFLMIGVLAFGMLDARQGGLKAPDELLNGVSLGAESSWMGIYLGGRKVGYIHSVLEPSGDGYEIREFSRIGGTMLGTDQQMRMRMTVQTDSTFALVAFQGQLEAEPYATQFTGEVKEQVLSIRITAAGKTTEKFLPAPEPIYLSQAIKPLLQAGRLDEGDSLKLAGFDPISMAMQDLVVIGANLEKHSLWGSDVLARKLTTRLAGMESSLYVDEDGNSLAEFSAMGLVTRRESMETALAGNDDQAPVDFLAIYAVTPVGRLKAPRKTKRATYVLAGINLADVINASDRQSLVDEASGVIEVSAERLKSNGDTTLLDRFRRDAPFIESRDRRIQERAREIVQGAKTAEDTLKILTNWVFHSVDKRPAAGIPSALAVLQQLEGDCNEHSVLFTALARSLGIPTRIQMGVVYQTGRFFYHAWPASFVGGVWREVDPTFGQTEADAARIALTTGDLAEVVNLAGVIGKLEIKIISED